MLSLLIEGGRIRTLNFVAATTCIYEKFTSSNTINKSTTKTIILVPRAIPKTSKSSKTGARDIDCDDPLDKQHHMMYSIVSGQKMVTFSLQSMPNLGPGRAVSQMCLSAKGEANSELVRAFHG